MAETTNLSITPPSVSLPAMTSSPRPPLAGIVTSSREGAPADSSEARLSRRRTASSITTNGHRESLEGPSLMTLVSGPQSSDSTVQICICPTDLKIPRPRNGKLVDFCQRTQAPTLRVTSNLTLGNGVPAAFMLYRQHLQSSVVAQHPGMTNPEISKIIGRQWREESQEVRDNWDALAEVILLNPSLLFESMKLINDSSARRLDISSSIPITNTSRVAKGRDLPPSPIRKQMGRRRKNGVASVGDAV